MIPFEKAFEEVAELVHKFDEHRGEFMAHNYLEDATRTDLLDEFWTAFGWDVRHREQTNPREQEVKTSKAEIAGSPRKVDYAFYLKPDYRQPIFFCEAKKPSRDLANADDYFQLVRYGYGASTPVGALTNFDEFHIIDCRYQPHIEKSYPSAQIKVFGYKDYLDQESFGYIYWLFSREAVATGKLKEYAGGLPKQRGTGKTKLTAEEAKPVDEAFLIKLEEYRRTLAKAFKKADEALTAEVLTEATQKVIDRLVFIRFLEDKYIETDYIVDQIAAKANRSGAVPAPTLSDARSRTGEAAREGWGTQPLQSKGGAWKSFLAWSKELDVKYNGVVFKPHDIDKSTFAPPDDKVFSELCADISHSHSKYLFTYIPIELLGSIYERFLGKVVTTTAKRAEIEDKPEVRKAGGVYYTPKYIVDYIVGNTVGKILTGDTLDENVIANGEGDKNVIARSDEGATKQSVEIELNPKGLLRRPSGTPRNDSVNGLTPKEISKLRFADIACGSGSFLIAVYDTVLHHVEKYYNDNPDEARKAKCTEIEKGIFALSLKQKQQILLDNIYGVDIDRQAVEVAQLSLFLKLLESESGATVRRGGQLSFERTKILPDLSKNIQCGNSLVEYDISDLFPLTPQEEMKIKPFSFSQAFKPIMDAGGFDAIVGNPPYVRQEGLGKLKEYFELHYKTFQGTADLYTYFIERAMTLLRKDGQFGYIVANKWMRANYGKPLREWLKQQQIHEIVDFGDLPVFTGATTYPCILRMEKGEPALSFEATNVETLCFENLQEYVNENNFSVRIDALNAASWSLTDEVAYVTLAKMKAKGVPLGEYVNGRIFYGVKTGLNDAFVIDKATRDKLVIEDGKSNEIIKPFLGGRDIKRYGASFPERYLIFARRGINIQAYPAVKNYLEQFKRQLIPRPSGHTGKDWPGRKPGTYKWYELQDTVDYFEEFEQPKIMLPDISQRGNFMLDMAGGMYTMNTSYIIGSPDRYLLGVLNSKCVTFFYSNLSPSYQGGYYRFIYQYLVQIPVPLIDPKDASSSKTKQSIIALVDQMLTTKQRMASTTRDSEREQLQNKCEYLDSEIDKLVYGLYGLSEEEIKIVEGTK